jgi:hypothetical protein
LAGLSVEFPRRRQEFYAAFFACTLNQANFGGGRCDR